MWWYLGIINAKSDLIGRKMLLNYMVFHLYNLAKNKAATHL